MKICDSIYVVGGGDDGFGLSHQIDCTVYLVDCGGTFALIDAGSGLGLEQILANIKADGIDPGCVEAVFVTHAHGDHCGGLAGLKEACGARAYAAKDCARFISEGDVQAMSLDSAIKAGIYPPGYNFPKAETTALEDCQAVLVGSREFTLYDTPGHSDGHACFGVALDGRKALFSGDLIFYNGRISLQSTWDCRLDKYWASIRRMGSIGVEGLFPGHQAFLVAGGQRTFDSAIACLDRLKVPANFI